MSSEIRPCPERKGEDTRVPLAPVLASEESLSSWGVLLAACRGVALVIVTFGSQLAGSPFLGCSLSLSVKEIGGGENGLIIVKPGVVHIWACDLARSTPHEPPGG